MRDLDIHERLTIPGRELTLAFARSGGPGGQNVNKVETKVEVRWSPGRSAALSATDRSWLLVKLAGKLTEDGALVVTSSRERTQERNREDALAKLAETIRHALVRPKKRRKTKPSRGSVERRLAGKTARSQIKKGRNWRGD